MLRRDYLLRQIEEFVGALMRMAGLAKAEQWEAASGIANSQFKSLAGAEAGELLAMSETELIARLAEGDSGSRIQEKIFMVARLFKESGDILRGQGRIEESHAYYLKGLRLLLDAMADDPASRRPEFFPSIESFLIGFHDSALNLETNALLMRHYEQVREYAKAEDALFGMLDTEPGNIELLDFGVGFYERLLRLDDEALELGNLPRAEVNSGLAELNARKRALVQGQNLER
jgi:tetratricopeptide (TPR) repeat protein